MAGRREKTITSNKDKTTSNYVCAFLCASGTILSVSHVLSHFILITTLWGMEAPTTYRWEDWSVERFEKFLEVPQLICGTAILTVWLHCPFPYASHSADVQRGQIGRASMWRGKRHLIIPRRNGVIGSVKWPYTVLFLVGKTWCPWKMGN